MENGRKTGERVQLTSKTSTARLTRATTSLQATSNYFLYFSAATKGTPKQGRRRKGGSLPAWLMQKWIMWLPQQSFFFSPHILLVFAFLALLGQAKGRAWKVGAALNRMAQFVRGETRGEGVAVGDYGAIFWRIGVTGA